MYICIYTLYVYIYIYLCLHIHGIVYIRTFKIDGMHVVTCVESVALHGDMTRYPSSQKVSRSRFFCVLHWRGAISFNLGN